MDAVAPMPYEGVNATLDGGFPRGALNHWKSNLLAEMGDEAIDTMIDRFEACPTPMASLLLEHFHGAATRVDATATALPHRQPGYDFAVITQWTDPAATDDCVAWSRGTYDAMGPSFAPGRFVNHLDDDEGEGARWRRRTPRTTPAWSPSRGSTIRTTSSA